MSLPTSGTISASMIQKELKESGSWSINSPSSRKLAKVPSGTIKFTDFYGKANTEPVTDYVLFDKTYYVEEPGYPGVNKSYNFNFDLNIPRKIINGTFTCKIYSNLHHRYLNRLSYNIRRIKDTTIYIPELFNLSLNTLPDNRPTNNKEYRNTFTKNVGIISNRTIKCSGYTGLYEFDSQRGGSVNDAYYFGMDLRVTVTFTGEWEPNNL